MAAAVYCAALATLYAKQDLFIFQPEGLVPDAAAAGVPGLRSIRVRTEDGLDLAAWFRPPPPGRPTLLYLHGNGGSLGGRTGRARRFAGLGWGLLLLEYRGYGGNPGTPGQDGFAADARAALSTLAGIGIPSERVAVYGESLGTGVAVRLATERPVAAVVLDSPYTSIGDVAQRRLPWFPARMLVRNGFAIQPRISLIRTPLLVIQGALDGNIPPDMGRAVFQAAQDPKELWVSTGGRHENVLETGGEAVMVAFLARHVPGR